MNELVRQYLNSTKTAHTAAGLTVAQVICAKRMSEAKTKEEADLLLAVMADIVEFLEELAEKNIQ